jgi:hypothetical protein
MPSCSTTALQRTCEGPGGCRWGDQVGGLAYLIADRAGRDRPGLARTMFSGLGTRKPPCQFGDPVAWPQTSQDSSQEIGGGCLEQRSSRT